jgi:hypothetical protein
MYGADNPIPGTINGTPGYIGSLRLGWDVDYYWGTELRYSMSTVGLNGVQTQNGLSDLHMLQTDANLLYYPWGDSKWRPYATAGIGFANYQFVYPGGKVNQTAVAMPFGGGLKYRHDAVWAFRFELLDNLTLNSGEMVHTMNNITLTAGVEAHLGLGRRRSYWPWNPSKAWF